MSTRRKRNKGKRSHKKEHDAIKSAHSQSAKQGLQQRQQQAVQHKRTPTLQRAMFREEDNKVLTAEIQEWIGGVIGTEIRDFRSAISSGELLWTLIKTVDPSLSVGKLHKNPSKFHSHDNVNSFLQSCKKIGVPTIVLCESSDVVEGKNYRAVITCILSLARILCDKYNLEPPEIIRMEMEIDQQRWEERQTADGGPSGDAESEAPSSRRGSNGSNNSSDDIESDKIDASVRIVLNNLDCKDFLQRLSRGRYQRTDTGAIVYIRTIRHVPLVRHGRYWDELDQFVAKECSKSSPVLNDHEVNEVIGSVRAPRDDFARAIGKRWFQLSGANALKTAAQLSGDPGQLYSTLKQKNSPELIVDHKLNDAYMESAVESTLAHSTTSEWIQSVFAHLVSTNDRAPMHILHALVERNPELYVPREHAVNLFFLLGFVEEEDAFWIMCALIDKLRRADTFARAPIPMAGRLIQLQCASVTVNSQCPQLLSAPVEFVQKWQRIMARYHATLGAEDLNLLSAITMFDFVFARSAAMPHANSNRFRADAVAVAFCEGVAKGVVKAQLVSAQKGTSAAIRQLVGDILPADLEAVLIEGLQRRTEAELDTEAGRCLRQQAERQTAEKWKEVSDAFANLRKTSTELFVSGADGIEIELIERADFQDVVKDEISHGATVPVCNAVTRMFDMLDCDGDGLHDSVALGSVCRMLASGGSLEVRLGLSVLAIPPALRVQSELPFAAAVQSLVFFMIADDNGAATSARQGIRDAISNDDWDALQNIASMIRQVAPGVTDALGLLAANPAEQKAEMPSPRPVKKRTDSGIDPRAAARAMLLKQDSDVSIGISDSDAETEEADELSTESEEGDGNDDDDDDNASQRQDKSLLTGTDIIDSLSLTSTSDTEHSVGSPSSEANRSAIRLADALVSNAAATAADALAKPVYQTSNYQRLSDGDGDNSENGEGAAPCCCACCSCCSECTIL